MDENVFISESDIEFMEDIKELSEDKQNNIIAYLKLRLDNEKQKVKEAIDEIYSEVKSTHYKYPVEAFSDLLKQKLGLE